MMACAKRRAFKRKDGKFEVYDARCLLLTRESRSWDVKNVKAKGGLGIPTVLILH